ncbi:DUF3375 family protein [Agrococcus sp. Ld7]|uniref:DUF3375 family protein n=1 Tax=Agrococcus sp. Ld7 TaxID=649148 RepID=UPI003867539A
MAIRSEHDATLRAFNEPALDILRAKHASWTIALLRDAFGTDAAPITAAQMETLIESGTQALRDDDHEVPDSTPNRILRGLVRKNLLTSYFDGDGVQKVRPTSHSQRALEYVREIVGDHRMISVSRVKTILESARAAAFDANESREERIRALQRQRDELDAEIQRLEGGGEVQTITPDGFTQAFSNLVDQIGSLPTDFLTITDSLEELRHDLLERYRDEQLGRSDIVDAYTSRANGMLTETPEGRAYLGAHELFLDETLLDGFRENIASLLRHPHAQLISRADRAQARATPNIIQSGMDGVIARRDAVVRTISSKIRRYDAMRRRELVEVLDRVDAGITAALERTTARWRKELPFMPERVALDPWVRSYPELTRHAPPKRLEAAGGASPAAVDWDDLSRRAGPDWDQIAAALVAARAAGGTTVGAVLAHLPEGRKRPVDLIGVIHESVVGTTAAREVVTTWRGDGTPVTYSIPLISILPKESPHA